MTRTVRLAPIALFLLPLAACGDSKQDAAQGSAGGQVLEGSISDAMLPLDSVRSQPPLAPHSGVPGGGYSGKSDSASRASGGPDDDNSAAPDRSGAAPAAAPEAPPAMPNEE